MNYDEVTAMALAYSDRSSDQELIANMGNFVIMAESRINRGLRVLEMTIRTTIETQADQIYYGLPSGFAGMRDIQIGNETGVYLSPEQMNDLTDTTTGLFYTIIANQLQIYPAQSDSVMELVYYQRLPNLQANETNWLSDRHPDCYVFAIMVEIESFVKSQDGATLWKSRLESTMAEITNEDGIDRWSGTAMTIKAT